MVYPTSPGDQLKYWFWRLYTPLHPLVRDVSSHFGIGRVLMWYAVPEGKQTGRQDYLLGTLHPAHSMRDFISFLVGQGFANHFVAWKDTDELVSLRRVVDFRHQYHIRVFRDGEVRCHFEYTPEYRPVRHLVRVGFEARAPEFRTLMRDWVVPSTD
ncbi:MAG: hypothetical protein B7W98_02205 [Parcubacteria group bacterium 20-58-5]|nr:MAG: hypothetical protein B7W98_02205 [Parcubacteria group bacterium 20-58-5]OYV63725.1 MAG: hypothetical protein B7X03_00595 [Parcubacteria group bacterium 21-58-10]HQT83187.1 hypothetical protein [Candidatus Paceibacterota bacterium]